jgi:uncharacterized cupin superfamily protein
VPPLAHWDDSPTVRRETGHIGGTWSDLGVAAGSQTVGVKRIQVDPGKWSTPAHREGAEEEIFYVLAGSGLSWQDGETFAVRAGDCLVHLTGAEAHTLLGGDEGLDVVAFGERSLIPATVLPRPGVAWFWPAASWLRFGSADEHPWRQEVAAGPPDVGVPSPRPVRIVNANDVPAEERSGTTVGRRVRNLGVAAGSQRTGIRLYTAFPGMLSVPLHCHSAEEELFVVLEGEGRLILLPSPQRAQGGGEPEEHPVRAGHAISRLPGTRRRTRVPGR